MADKLSHIDEQGKARMVYVGDKPVQQRMARAQGIIYLQPETILQVTDNSNKKGDVLTVAEIAGIQAAKKTSDLIPLCHTLLLSKVSVETEILSNAIKVTSQVRCEGKTGVEMEALTAVGVALLTIYDMCKAIDKTMKISGIELIEKTKE